ncbi:MAG TPA: hypothetical protein VGI28_09220 [Stellaceae bacterium]
MRASDQMDLPAGAGVDPEPRHPRDCRATGIGIEAKHALVKTPYGIELGLIRIDADRMVMNFKDTNGHRRPPELPLTA